MRCWCGLPPEIAASIIDSPVVKLMVSAAPLPALCSCCWPSAAPAPPTTPPTVGTRTGGSPGGTPLPAAAAAAAAGEAGTCSGSSTRCKRDTGHLVVTTQAAKRGNEVTSSKHVLPGKQGLDCTPFRLRVSHHTPTIRTARPLTDLTGMVHLPSNQHSSEVQEPHLARGATTTCAAASCGEGEARQHRAGCTLYSYSCDGVVCRQPGTAAAAAHIRSLQAYWSAERCASLSGASSNKVMLLL
jgi:hypothetical protein